MKTAKKIYVTFGLCMVLSGCQSFPEPIEEYTLARAALDAARAVQAQRNSPAYWQKADEFYRQARILYREREFAEAKNLFIKARQAAETAETQSRIIRFKNGEIL